jgi:hypothetical protein
MSAGLSPEAVWPADGISYFHVTQRVMIAALSRDTGEQLLRNAERMLSDASFGAHIESLIDANRVLFYSEHLDVWSMGDSFERFLRPTSKVTLFAHGSEQLYALPRRLLTLRPRPRGCEERLLRDLLRLAKSQYAGVAPDAWIFVWRRAVHISREPIGDAEIVNS